VPTSVVTLTDASRCNSSDNACGHLDDQRSFQWRRASPCPRTTAADCQRTRCTFSGHLFDLVTENIFHRLDQRLALSCQLPESALDVSKHLFSFSVHSAGIALQPRFTKKTKTRGLTPPSRNRPQSSNAWALNRPHTTRSTARSFEFPAQSHLVGSAHRRATR